MGAGRPTDYRPQYCQLLVDHMAEGLSFESFAGIVRVSKQTLYDWQEANIEFLEARKKGIELCRLYWEKLGKENIISGKESLNTGVYVFNMKNRFPDEWRDKKEVDNTHEFKNRPDWLDAAK